MPRFESEPVRIEEKEELGLFDRVAPFLRYAAVGALAFTALESSGVLPRNIKEATRPARREGAGVSCEIGSVEPVILEVKRPEYFSKVWNENKISTNDPEVQRLIDFSSRDYYTTQPRDVSAFNTFMEKQAEARLGPGVEPTPGQAILLSQQIVLDNCTYDVDIAQAVNNLRPLEDAGTERGELGTRLRHGIEVRKQEINQFPPEELYAGKTEIVCTHAAGLFKQNIEWLKQHKGKNLKNLYVGLQLGAGAGSSNPRVENHIWGKAVHLFDQDGDGRPDVAELSYIDPTPLTAEGKRRGHGGQEFYAEIELVETIRSLASLWRNGVMNETEYANLIQDALRIVRSDVEANRISPQEGARLEASLIRDFGAQVVPTPGN